jgi:hypothetical protein
MIAFPCGADTRVAAPRPGKAKVTNAIVLFGGCAVGVAPALAGAMKKRLLHVFFAQAKAYATLYCAN